MKKYKGVEFVDLIILFNPVFLKSIRLEKEEDVAPDISMGHCAVYWRGEELNG